MRMNIKKFARHQIIPATIVAVVACFVVGFTLVDSDYFFKINKSIDIFGRVYKEVTLNYVDEVDPQKFMESGINGLLGTLDPYTNFFNETEGDELELITSGKYGGIGITIGVREGYITITSLMEGYSAQRQGLIPGDRIIEIGGKSVVGFKPDEVRSLTRGEPGTEVHLKVEREGEKEPLAFVLVREEIQLKNITYAEFIGDDIGYIHLERFSRGAGDEMRVALKELKVKGNLRGLILDLRDNPGGLLDAAVDVVEKFVPKGSLVVSTRGRRPETEKKYYANEEPISPEIPVIILTNHNSASASEIVAGAIQDLDRGVILGTRSFGKGLVQTVVPLAFNTQLKMTSAKYYTPSGRCIQEIDYMHKNKDGVFTVVPDSLRHEFKTSKGRSVYESGGITPDSSLEEQEATMLQKELLRKLMFFKFATHFVSEHKEMPIPFPSDDALLSQFQAFLSDQKFTYQNEVEKKIIELQQIVDKSKYSQTVLDALKRLSTNVDEEKNISLERERKEVLHTLKPELMSRYKGEVGRTSASLTDDVQVNAAKGLLKASKEYQTLLARKNHTEK